MAQTGKIKDKLLKRPLFHFSIFSRFVFLFQIFLFNTPTPFPTLIVSPCGSFVLRTCLIENLTQLNLKLVGSNKIVFGGEEDSQGFNSASEEIKTSRFYCEDHLDVDELAISTLVYFTPSPC